ncbi:MAG TPA: carbohydrate binding domain-containing protein [Balneolaceae bacterium]|nr:carbohydrate binding domain-containing protein [Balneolaceae bacterium]
MKIHTKITALLITVLGVISFTSCGVNDTEADLDELNAKIDVSSVDFITDLEAIDGRRIKTNQSITLSDGSTGEPDGWEWTFSDDTNTITDEDASASWSEAVGEVTITLTVTRSSDGATDTGELVLQVGPVEKLNRDVYAFEESDTDIDPLSKWFHWTPNDGTVSTSLETSDGADGSSQSIKLTATTGFEEFQLRPHENGPEFLVSLESNKSYVFSFYMKASQALTLSEVSILNVKNDAPKEGWYTPLWTGDSEIADPEVATSWKKFSYEFTTADLTTFADEGYADGTADHAGPFFKHFGTISDGELSVWIDEISLKEKEQN